MLRLAHILATGLLLAAAIPAALAGPGVLPAPNPAIAGASAPSPGTLLALTGGKGDVEVFGEVHIKPGEVHPKDLVVIGGKATVEGEVRGDIVVICGNLHFSGTAHAAVVTVLSSVNLDQGGVIQGEFVNVLGRVERHPDAQIEGDFVDLGFLDLSGMGFGGIGGGFMALLRLIKIAKLAVLFLIIIIIAALVPKRVAYAGNAFATDWPKALLYGLLAYVVGIVAIIILCITLIGIPVAVGLGIAMKIAKWMGLTSIFFLLGDRIGRNLFGREFSLFPSILFGYVIFGALRFVPLFVGEMIWAGLAVLAVGLSLATRFGSGEPWFGGRRRETQAPPGPAPPAWIPPSPPPGSEPGTAAS